MTVQRELAIDSCAGPTLPLCLTDGCQGHRMMVHDWEMLQSFRKWSREYGATWEEKFRQKFERELPAKDFQFFVGTMKARPWVWSIVGLYYPPFPKASSSQVLDHQASLFP